MLKAVLDTNIIISGLNFSGSPAQALELAAKRVIQNVISQDILDEVQGVLAQKFSWEKERVQDAIDLIRLVSEFVDPQEKVSVVAHEPDNRIIECAISGNANLIVSGDKKHLLPLKESHGILIVGPNEFLNILEHDG